MSRALLGALLAAMVAFGLALSGCGRAEPAGRGGGTENARTIRGHGLSLELPPGWHGGVAPVEPSSAPMLRAATFPLSERPSDIGQQAQRTMGDGDILISVADYGLLPNPKEPKELSAVSLPITVDRSHVGLFEGFREPVATRAFVVNGHAFQLWVVFGSPDPSDELLGKANTVLATLAVQPRRLELDGLSIELPQSWDGFAKDLGSYEPAPAVYAANVPWPDRGQNLAGPATREAFERLPPSGIVITASAGRHGGEESQRVLERPIRLSDGYFLADSYEGQPAPHVSTQLIFGRVGERFLNVQVYFGRNELSEAMRAAANAVLASLELGPEPPPGSGPGWRQHRDGEHGVAVRYPSGWQIAEERLTPFLGDPAEILHLATYRVRPGGDRCAHVPEQALEDLGPTDALISLYERRQGTFDGFPPRSRHLLPFEGEEPESIDCLKRPKGERLLYRLIAFRDAGRRFHLYVAIGEDASFETRRQTAEILDSLRFDQR